MNVSDGLAAYVLYDGSCFLFCKFMNDFKMMAHTIAAAVGAVVTALGARHSRSMVVSSMAFQVDMLSEILLQCLHLMAELEISKIMDIKNLKYNSVKSTLVVIV